MATKPQKKRGTDHPFFAMWVDNSELLLRPGMTATAEIKVTEVRDALLVPNAALRYSPAATTTTPNRGFLRSLLPGRPAVRPASQHDETGRSRTVWTLAGGAPTRTNIVIGLSDGKRTQVETGDLDAGEPVIVDQTLARR